MNCPICGTRIHRVVTTGPSTHETVPCGCRADLSVRREFMHPLMTDGGTNHSVGDRYHKGNGPYSNHETRKALLVLGPKDIVTIDGHGEMEVYNREEPYFGVELTVGNDESNYRIVPDGFANDPELWRVDTDKDGFIIGFEFVDNVSLEVTRVGKSLRCPICMEVLQNEMERRMALIGQYCPHKEIQT